MMFVTRAMYEAKVAECDRLWAMVDSLLTQAEAPAPKPEPEPTFKPEPLPEPVTQAMMERAQPGSAAWRRLRKYVRDAQRAGQSPSLIAESILNGVG